MKLSFYNTLSRKKEHFVPIAEGKVTLYTCGPTVHDHAHIGNFRTFVFYDLLRRTLRRAGYQVLHVTNLTDVEDRIIQKAGTAGLSLRDFTEPFAQAFESDRRALRIEDAEHYPRATDYVPEIIQLIVDLERRGHAYASEGSVYFRIASFPEYGRLSRLNLDSNVASGRVDHDTFDKEEAHDFAVWKAARPGEPSWPSPWGPGRPGWHIECSAMAIRLLGPTLDIHAGGVDLIFPHHENEIAQSEAATGKAFARYWLHPEHLHIDGTKMSKRLGNFSTVRELLARGVEPRQLRYSFLGTHYKKQMNFSEESLEQAAAALARLDNTLLRLDTEATAEVGTGALDSAIQRQRTAFDEALGDDLNLPEALAALHGLIGEINTALDQHRVTAAEAATARAALADLDGVLAIFPEPTETAPAEVLAAVREREAARTARNWQEADRLRSRLLELGWVVEDVKGGGSRWKRA